MAATGTATATATALAPAAARHLEEYHRLSLLLNRHISDLGAASAGGPAVARVLVEADLAFAEAEGEVGGWVNAGGGRRRGRSRGLESIDRSVGRSRRALPEPPHTTFPSLTPTRRRSRRWRWSSRA